MDSLRRYSLTKQDLIDNGYFVEGDKVFKNCTSRRCRGIKEIKTRVIARKTKYGNDKKYCYVFMRIKKFGEHKRVHITLHTIIYAWYKGEVPLGYDIDHVDNNPFNNNIDNLELVTHAENMRRCQNRGLNHWYYIKGYDNESWSKRKQELNNERNNRKLRKELKPQYDLYMKNLKAYIKKAKDARDFKTWHELISKKITFGEYVNKYKETMGNGKEEKE